MDDHKKSDRPIAIAPNPIRVHPRLSAYICGKKKKYRPSKKQGGPQPTPTKLFSSHQLRW
ncbi:hypothetical protein [Microcoleus sp. bin38.metabat.b11b12b14.051]|uniref:hypothetical protein n=1 Tax=Microcoleus sp. bin38.metabat.b11b12b14.051 TaxID=2742709 RepID=UPI0025D7681E|nr:hypothetical protein [Microcoleus sp. bin38.metabat.b11b12b14.051]